MTMCVYYVKVMWNAIKAAFEANHAEYCENHIVTDDEFFAQFEESIEAINNGKKYEFSF